MFLLLCFFLYIVGQCGVPASTFGINVSPFSGEVSDSESNSSCSSSDSDSSSEDEFTDGYGEDLMGDEEDRARLEQMTEKEREQELFNRIEKREVLKRR